MLCARNSPLIRKRKLKKQPKSWSHLHSLKPNRTNQSTWVATRSISIFRVLILIYNLNGSPQAVYSSASKITIQNRLTRKFWKNVWILCYSIQITAITGIHQESSKFFLERKSFQIWQEENFTTQSNLSVLMLLQLILLTRYLSVKDTRWVTFSTQAFTEHQKTIPWRYSKLYPQQTKFKT